jgi:hypothetical protein
MLLVQIECINLDGNLCFTNGNVTQVLNKFQNDNEITIENSTLRSDNSLLLAVAFTLITFPLINSCKL